MQVCLEIGTDFYLPSFRNRVMAVPLGFCDLSGVYPGIELDFLQFSTAEIISPTQIGIPITATLTTDEALTAAPSGTAPADLTSITLTVLLTLSAASAMTGPNSVSMTITIAYAGVQAAPGTTLPATLQNLIDQLGPALTTKVSMDLGAITMALMLPPTALPNTAIGLSATTQSVAILLDWDGIGPFSASAITAGQLPGTVSPAPGENLSMILSTDLVSNPVEAAVTGTFTGDLQLDSALVPQWSELPGQAMLHFAFQGTKKGGCKLPLVDWGLKDISFDATLDVTVSLQPPASGGGTGLQSAGAFDFKLHPEDVIECTIILGALAGVAGAIAGFEVGGPAGSRLGATAAAVVAAAAVLITAGNASQPPPTPGFCTLSADGNSFVCLTDVPPRCIAGPPFIFTRLSGPQSGPGGTALVLHGTLLPPTPASQPAIQNVTVTDWQTSGAGTCDTSFAPYSSRVISLTFDPPPQASQTAPCPPVPGGAAGINICPLEFIGQENIPPLQQLYAATLVQDTVRRTADITVSFQQEALAPTYNCILRVKTTAGARQFDLGLPPTLSATEQQGIERVIIERRGQCVTLVTGWHGIPGVWDPNWLVDPEPPVEQVMHLWEIAITGIPQITGVNLGSVAGREKVASAAADHLGTVEVGALLAPTAPGDVVLHRLGGAPAPSSNIYAMQSVLLKQGSFAVPSPVTHLQLARLGRQDVAIIGQADQLMLVALYAPGIPLLTGAGPASAIARLGVRLPAIVQCGDVGVSRGRSPRDITWLGLSGVQAAVDVGDWLFIQRDAWIEALRLAAGGVTRIGATTAPDRTLFRIEGTTPTPRIFLRAPHGGGEVMSIDTRTGRFTEVARYRHDPWFLNAARSSTWFLRAGAGHEVTIHRVLASARSSLDGIEKNLAPDPATSPS